MKKYIVLTILFVFPLVVYLFFASGVNNFAKLPIINNSVIDVGTYSENSFKGNISVLGFLGDDLSPKKSNALNINQKIYKRFYQFEDFQFLIIQPKGSEDQVQELKNELAGNTGTDVSKWNFVFLSPVQIEVLYESLQTGMTLDEDYSTPYVYIIDKDGFLRGRDETDSYGYDARSVADINNNMVDDVKVILAEYRLALKKYTIDRQI